LLEAHGATTLTTLSVPISNDKAPPIVEAPKGVLQKPSETSLKKKEANRRNALKSTGPRTTAGKRTARFNAMKHGFLSKQIVISSRLIQERADDFEALVAQCWEYFQPVGRPEELLVEQVAVCFWSARRAVRCELGEIRK